MNITDLIIAAIIIIGSFTVLNWILKSLCWLWENYANFYFLKDIDPHERCIKYSIGYKNKWDKRV